MLRALRRFFARLSTWALRKLDDTRLTREIEEHVALQVDENLRAGLSPAEARRQALLKFGPMEAAKEAYRDQRGLPSLETLVQDTRRAVRNLRQAPVFTIAASLTLALGIGATTSIFTLMHAVLLKSLPVSNPEQLYRLGKGLHCCIHGGYVQGKEFSIVSYELYRYLRDHTKGFDEMAAFQAGGTFVGARRAHRADTAESYFGEFVSGNYFTMFGLGPYSGRVFTTSDDDPGAPPVAVMSYRVWQQKYGLDPSVIGAVFNIDDRPFTVVGVTPPAFYGDRLRPMPPDFYLPLSTEPLVKGESSMLRNSDTQWLNIIGRVQAGARIESVEAQMRVELQQWLHSHWGDMSPNQRLEAPKQTLFLSPGGAGLTYMRRQYEQWLQILMTVSGFVLLIVCANVANLMLVRGMERRQQTSVSIALGARAGRLVRQALTESVLLSLLGGVIGLGVAFATTSLILHFAFDRTTAIPISASPSMPVLLFAFAVSLATGVAFGIGPAWMATRADPIDALRGANRSTRDSASLPRKMLVVLQAALSLVLLSAAGLLSEALHHLEHHNFGFEQPGRAIVKIDPVLAGYKPEQLDVLYRRIHESFASIPGVASVAFALYTPMSGDAWGEGIFVEGKPTPPPGANIGSSWARVSPGYFETIGNRIIKGRPIMEQDTASSPHVAVVNEAFARKFFPSAKGTDSHRQTREKLANSSDGASSPCPSCASLSYEDPIGKHFGKNGVEYARDYEIVGVARDARYFADELDKPVDAFAFLPESQWNQYTEPIGISTETRSHYLHDIVVRIQPGATFSEAMARHALASVDPNLPAMRVETLSEQVESNFGQQRLLARLTSLFGLLSLFLASIGVYGIVAFNAGTRTNEIGVRMALGADRRNILNLILRGAFLPITAGLVLGTALTFGAGRVLTHQLYGISQYDPLAISGSLLALALSALIAALIPASRASVLPPMQALRTE
jgi:predicted permease